MQKKYPEEKDLEMEIPNNKQKLKKEQMLVNKDEKCLIDQNKIK